MEIKPSFKIDKFKKARGGNSRWLLITCGECKNTICYYQKDGVGFLKRLYLDRIFNNRFTGKNLICNKCKALLGLRYIYEKENRPAFRLFAGVIEKKTVKSQAIAKKAALS